MAVEIISILLAITATVLSFIFILPEKRKNSLPAFFRVVRDIFNFSYLVIEKVLKALYILSTTYVIFYGFFGLFATHTEGGSYDWYSDKITGGHLVWDGWRGLLLMILGPIVIRLAYELAIMAILLVQNVIEINHKIKNQNEDKEKASSLFNVPSYTSSKKPATKAFCANCGTHLDENGICPNCGKK